MDECSVILDLPLGCFSGKPKCMANLCVLLCIWEEEWYPIRNYMFLSGYRRLRLAITQKQYWSFFVLRLNRFRFANSVFHSNMADSLFWKKTTWVLEKQLARQNDRATYFRENVCAPHFTNSSQPRLGKSLIALVVREKETDHGQHVATKWMNGISLFLFHFLGHETSCPGLWRCNWWCKESRHQHQHQQQQQELSRCLGVSCGPCKLNSRAINYWRLENLTLRM